MNIDPGFLVKWAEQVLADQYHFVCPVCDGVYYAGESTPRHESGCTFDDLIAKARAELAGAPLNRHGEPRPEGWYPGFHKDRRAWEAANPGKPFVGKGKV